MNPFKIIYRAFLRSGGHALFRWVAKFFILLVAMPALALNSVILDNTSGSTTVYWRWSYGGVSQQVGSVAAGATSTQSGVLNSGAYDTVTPITVTYGGAAGSYTNSSPSNPQYKGGGLDLTFLVTGAGNPGDKYVQHNTVCSKQ